MYRHRRFVLTCALIVIWGASMLFVTWVAAELLRLQHGLRRQVPTAPLVDPLPRFIE
jgi:hypothetical protein